MPHLHDLVDDAGDVQWFSCLKAGDDKVLNSFVHQVTLPCPEPFQLPEDISLPPTLILGVVRGHNLAEEVLTLALTESVMS